MAVTRAIGGLNKTLKNMDAVPAKMTGAVLGRAAEKALTPMRDEARQNALPRRQAQTPNGKHLDQGIHVTRGRGGRFRVVRYLTIQGKRQIRIAHLVEFGTAPHWQPRRFGGIMHPGARPYPYLRPAYEVRKNEVGQILGKLLWVDIRSAILKGNVR